ncbi:MAG: FAD-dependent oxidoreductase [Ghiorsea sp.]
MLEKEHANNHYDFIIVGQGLAGSLLAWSLLKKGAKVCIISDQKDCASRVAAGLINPVTGQRFVLAEQTPNMLEYAETFYKEIEQKLGIKCYHPQPMIRLFNSDKEEENCTKRLSQKTYKPFLKIGPIPNAIKSTHSGILQNKTAWLDTNLLLDSLEKYFEKHTKIIHKNADLNTIKHHENHIVWQGISANKLIYCQGYKMKDNPMFSWLPLQPAHGEILTCSSDKKLSPNIINKSKWLLPIDEYSCRIGATFEPKLKEPICQVQSKQDLLAFALDVFTEKHDFNCTQHQAGIRPATKDKQPFIGYHPVNQNICIFNGFGSRGSLLIPWYAQAWSNSLIHSTPIPKEADIIRYLPLCV